MYELEVVNFITIPIVVKCTTIKKWMGLSKNMFESWMTKKVIMRFCLVDYFPWNKQITPDFDTSASVGGMVAITME